MKIQLFALGGCPGTPKNHPRSAFKIQCDFLLIFAPKMAPLGLPFSTFLWTMGVVIIDPGDVFAGCSPQPRPKWPKASHKTSPGTPQGAPRAPQRPPGTPPGMPQGIKMRPQGFPRTPQGSPRDPFLPFWFKKWVYLPSSSCFHPPGTPQDDPKNKDNNHNNNNDKQTQQQQQRQRRQQQQQHQQQYKQ